MLGRSRNSVEFLSDWQIGDALLRIVTQAREQLTLVSPYNNHWGHLGREVTISRSRGVSVTIFYRADQPNPLASYKDIAGVPVQNLHAKIYANEQATLVTSMNLLETSLTHAREVGFLVHDAKLRHEVHAYINSLADRTPISDSFTLNPVGRNGNTTSQHTVETANDIAKVIDTNGFCIECGDQATFDLNRPLCRSCYFRIGINGSPRLCHNCGQTHGTQINRPLCPACVDAHSQ
jgi:hypothetical protein